MSHLLWKYYLEDDVDRFRHLLETATYNVRNNAQKGGGGLQNIGSGGASVALGTSPGLHVGSSPLLSARKGKTPLHGTTGTPGGSGQGPVNLTRGDINWRDGNGMTILHHAASSTSENAIGFAQCLLDHQLVDLYLQDAENGWTALHRAFYFGNITIARAILERDSDNAFGRAIGGKAHNALGLIKIKDREGMGPLDLYAASIQDRTLHPDLLTRTRSNSNPDSEPDIAGPDGDEHARYGRGLTYKDIAGDECYTFGSNRNTTLGFGDEDDRQWPERITLRRPEHLLQRFYREHMERAKTDSAMSDSLYLDGANATHTRSVPVDSMPWVVRSRPIKIQDIFMAKLHTAVLTDDPESNLHVCGHGQGGRLGLGHEQTQFTFACVEGGGLAGKKVASVALGQNHTLAITDAGELFSWGSNPYGQLGYSLPKSGVKDEEPIQPWPRQLFGSVKRETIQGIAASRIHSVAFTGSSLYTWGKNEGQLGLVDSDARSLEIQSTPRKVAASLFSTPIEAVSAIDRATICLLSSSHDCWVFANYGYAKVQFPLDSFSNYFLNDRSWMSRVERGSNYIVKITSGGDTIGAMSSNGQVYTLSVGQPQGAQTAGASTTNPGKIKAALSQPQKIWSLKKNNMAARDVGVDADGSIIITTEEGSVWKRSRRAKIKDAIALGTAEYKPKDYKFSRISGLTRVIGVRASSYGAYAAVRRDCDVTKTQIAVEPSGLWDDLLPLLSFKDFSTAAMTPDSESENPEPRFWQAKVKDETVILKKHMLQAKDLEDELRQFLLGISDPVAEGYDLCVASTVSDLRIPVHQTVLTARSRFLRDKLSSFIDGAQTSEADGFNFDNSSGLPTISFHGIDPLTLINFVLYCYTDSVIDYWHYASRLPKMAHRYRTIRAELMKLAANLGLRKLEASVRQMITTTRTLNEDFDSAFCDPAYFDNADILVELADDEVPVHSSILCRRCPFFEGMFMGRAGGRWLDDRRDAMATENMVRIDLKHIEAHVFKLVLRHIYADSGEELFDHTTSADLEEFFDFVMEVLSVANELMLDRLAQICQSVMGRYVNVRNVCSLLNAVAPSSVSEFKDASLEYMCLSLEAMLHSGLLDELDEDLLLELDEVVRSNQLACMPFAKSGRAEALLLENHPELADILERNRQAKIDAVNLSTKHQDVDNWASTSFRAQSIDEDRGSPSAQKSRRRSKVAVAPKHSPAFRGKEAIERLGMSFDEGIDVALDLGSPALDMQNNRRASRDVSGTPSQDVWYDSKGKALSPPASSPSLMATKPSVQASPNLRPSPTPRSASLGVPWGSSPASGQKLDMKDIMAQTTSNRVSHLSAGIAASRSTSDTAPSPGSSGKLSQKERKKMLQQQAAQQEEEKRRFTTLAEAAASPSRGTPPAKSSPWQTVGSSSKVPSLQDVMQKEFKPASVPSKPAASRAPSTPQLTMRQTIANPKPSPSTPTTTPHSAAKAGTSPTLARPAPTKSQSTPARPTPSKTQSTPAAPPHSVRHQPPPPLPTVQLSMADILYLQQEEKDSIARVKEENAKRSLQDIQAEQEFQLWWEAEEKRYKIANGLLPPDEEEEGAEQKGKDGKAGKGRRGGRGGKRGAKSDGGGRVDARLPTETVKAKVTGSRGKGGIRGGRSDGVKQTSAGSAPR